MALLGISSLGLYVYDNYTRPILYEIGREIRKIKNKLVKCNFDTFMTSCDVIFAHFIGFAVFYKKSHMRLELKILLFFIVKLHKTFKMTS